MSRTRRWTSPFRRADRPCPGGGTSDATYSAVTCNVRVTLRAPPTPRLVSLPFRTVRALLNILPSPLVFPTLLAVAAPLVVSRALSAQAPAAPRPTPATGTPLRISGTLRSAESREVVRHARVVADRTVSVESNEEGVYFLTPVSYTHLTLPTSDLV